MKRVLALVCAFAILPAVAFAVVPDPSLSNTPDCVLLFPNGSYTVSGQVIGNNNLPLGNNEVRLVIAAGCTGVRLCPLPGTPAPFTITTTANGTGNFSFAPHAGGCCSIAISASIEADPGAVTLRTYASIGSPDSTGDLAVTLGDFVNFQAAFNSSNTCSDIDGSCANQAPGYTSPVTLADFVTFQANFNTGC